MEEELLMYILVNKDLQMSKGKTSAQVAHAVTNFLVDQLLYSTNPLARLIVLKWRNEAQKKL